MAGSRNWRAVRDTCRYRHHYPVRSCRSSLSPPHPGQNPPASRRSRPAGWRVPRRLFSLSLTVRPHAAAGHQPASRLLTLPSAPAPMRVGVQVKGTPRPWPTLEGREGGRERQMLTGPRPVPTCGVSGAGWACGVFTSPQLSGGAWREQMPPQECSGLRGPGRQAAPSDRWH